LKPYDLLPIHPSDAERLDIRNGERVVLASRYGRIELPVELTGKVRKGELFSTFHDPDTFVNRITSNVRDRYVDAPEYKVTAVRIEKLES
jgi:formate dehydrogenase major subunit